MNYRAIGGRVLKEFKQFVEATNRRSLISFRKNGNKTNALNMNRRKENENNTQKCTARLPYAFFEGYAEKLVQLALGAANLFAQIRCGGHYGRVSELRTLAEQYCESTAHHPGIFESGTAERKAVWDAVRASNRFPANIYDIVERATLMGSRYNTYLRSIDDSDNEFTAYAYAVDLMNHLTAPKRYRKKKLLEKFKKKRYGRPKR